MDGRIIMNVDVVTCLGFFVCFALWSCSVLFYVVCIKKKKKNWTDCGPALGLNQDQVWTHQLLLQQLDVLLQNPVLVWD